MQLRKIIFALGGMLLSTTALADTTDIQAANNQLSIQSTSTSVNYTEMGNGVLGANGTILDTEGGSVGGYNVSLSMMQDILFGNDYLSVQYSHSSGSTNYIGSYQNGTYGQLTAVSGATLINYSARYGRGFTTQNLPNVMVTPYVELGHHEWDRGVNTGETYTNNSIGVGLLGQYSATHKLILSAYASVGELFNSNITANAIPGGNFSGFSGGLGNDVLNQLGANADYAFTTHFHANVGINYMRFNYGASNLYSVGNGYLAGEPKSSTTYTVLTAGIGYSF